MELGILYHEGDGVRVNFGKSVKWYRWAAEQGESRAQYNLGQCYRDGEGVKRSKRWAAYWFRKAAANRERDAVKDLRRLMPRA